MTGDRRHQLPDRQRAERPLRAAPSGSRGTPGRRPGGGAGRRPLHPARGRRRRRDDGVAARARLDRAPQGAGTRARACPSSGSASACRCSSSTAARATSTAWAGSPATSVEFRRGELRVPHMGWNAVRPRSSHPFARRCRGRRTSTSSTRYHALPARRGRRRRRHRVRRRVRLASSPAATSWPRSSTSRRAAPSGLALLSRFAELSARRSAAAGGPGRDADDPASSPASTSRTGGVTKARRFQDNVDVGDAAEVAPPHVRRRRRRDRLLRHHGEPRAAPDRPRDRAGGRARTSSCR